MALRVLLADESSTIKRVIQLALQDFGVEVKSVPVGLDVLPVAKAFKPDIILADVLLAKRSGYEVSADIKGDKELKATPVVLMWSGFMELDEAKTVASKVDRRLEKPFDPEQLRSMVKELVPSLRTNAISDYLNFPNRPEFVEEAADPGIQLGGDAQEIDGEDAEDFRHVPLPKPGRDIQASQDKEDWSQADLNKFRVSNVEPSTPFEEIEIPDTPEEVDESSFTWTNADPEHTENTDFTSTKRGEPTIKPPPRMPPPPPAPDDSYNRVPTLDFERAEQIIRQQAHDVLESIAWKILPDITERIVREELQKLLKDSERLDQV